MITSAQVKFRETIFPMRLSSDAPQPEKEEDAILWDDVDDDDDDNIMPGLVDTSEVDSEEDYQNDAVSGPDGDDDDDDDNVDDDAEDGDDEEAPAQRRGRSAGGLEDWKSVFTDFEKGRAEVGPSMSSARRQRTFLPQVGTDSLLAHAQDRRHQPS